MPQKEKVSNQNMPDNGGKKQLLLEKDRKETIGFGFEREPFSEALRTETATR